MAALDTPWMTSMTDRPAALPDGKSDSHTNNHAPTTTAAFSPHPHASSIQQRSTILLHQKSPLLLATPPQVTRALAYSHAFLIPLNKTAALLSWTTGDPWESFLLLAAFWFTVLYGDTILRYAGPLILVVFLILGMYLRRYSPLSSTGWTGEKKKSGSTSESGVQHRKSLDEILATLQAFTGRCNILLAPMLQMTDFLSTQQTATSATTRPALTTLFVRILFATPLWFILTLPPLRIITAKRIVLLAGTLILTWHSRPARISRAILWRSNSVRHAAALLTGLNFVAASASPIRTSAFPPSNMAALKDMKSGHQSIRFTFSLYENQRRWIGLGWTANMVAYERAPWTDEHLNATSPKDTFQLPDIEGGHAKWRWAEGSSWKVDIPPLSPALGKDKNTSASKRDEEAWVYYDNKWLNGTRGQDGWSKYTRRRKWIRDAELVDADTEALVATSDKDPAPGNSRDGEPLKRAPPLEVKSKDASQEGSKSKAAGKKAPEVVSEIKHKKKESVSPADGSADDASATGFDAPSPARNRRSWFGRQRGEHDTQSIDTAVASEGYVRDKSRGVSPARSRGESDAGPSRRPRHGSSSSGPDVPWNRGTKAAPVLGTSLDSSGGWSGHHSRGGSSGGFTTLSERERKRDEGQDTLTPTERLKQREADWGLGDDVSMELG
ncbi:Pex24p-domain-containing protein [Myriangium duriaei CBS 260.36]|uniref:Pex24p-domain-containing protein n=1 Tax=Myriangium duriaei CBS 260.36 TaxID=1168546 RepID=A0A9P4MJZ8_9PEZI|nr:Pex24p-domain-containing protein [Myriangium duriaei CBS 260.36]